MLWQASDHDHDHANGCLFCVVAPQDPGAAGQAAALVNTDQVWQRKACLWVETQPLGKVFTADDLVEACGLPEWISTNAIGAIFGKMSKAGTINAVGYTHAKRTSSHSRVIRLWQRV